MPILDSEDDDQSILDDVFALIDSSSEFGSESCRSAHSDIAESSSQSDAEEINAATIRSERPSRTPQCAAKPKKKRIRRPETSSTAFQRKRKAEVFALRDEAAALETRLREMKQKRKQMWAKHLGNGAGQDDSQFERHVAQYKWCEQALEQYHQRLRSEKLNLKLKAELDGQVRMNGDILALLRKRYITLGNERFVEESPAAPDRLVSIDSGLAAILQLELRAELLSQKRADTCSQPRRLPVSLVNHV